MADEAGKAGAKAHSKTIGADITGLERIKAPELVIGLVAAVGADLETIEKTLQAVLHRYRYRSTRIKLTEKLGAIMPKGQSQPEKRLARICRKMNEGNEFRARTGRKDAMALLAVMAIRQERQVLYDADAAQTPLARADPRASTPHEVEPSHLSKSPRSHQAYIVRQLKRPEEVESLRRVYGHAFLLIGAHESRAERERRLAEQHAQDSGRRRTNKDDRAARVVIDRDEDESASPSGQKLSDTYHLADAIVDARTPEAAEAQLTRIFDAFFGKPFATPTRAEYFLNLARQVALRSADLSRQVGAVIVSDDDAILGTGCNDVPRPGGGCYWDGEEGDARDFRLGYDPSVKQKQAILGDAFKRLGENGWLVQGKSKSAIEEPARLVETATAKDPRGPLAGAHVTDLLEFGRVVHAEMNALAEAARSGRSVAGATLYCTTFPCHMCARHIVASGIGRVVYLEPYPKSLALELHGDAIIEGPTEAMTDRRVVFDPFIGVSPQFFSRVFSMVKTRKTSDGDIIDWQAEDAMPRIDLLSATYIPVEDVVIDFFSNILDRADLVPPEPSAPSTP